MPHRWRRCDGRAGVPVLLVVAGIGLAIAGAVLAVAWYGYEIFSLPIMSARDVAAAVAVGAAGLVLAGTGVVLLLRARQSPAP